MSPRPRSRSVHSGATISPERSPASPPNRRRRVLCLCDRERRSRVLGGQHHWRARQRFDDPGPRARPDLGPNECRHRHRCRRRARMRGRKRCHPVLGEQRLWRAREQFQHEREQRARTGHRPDERRHDHRCRRVLYLRDRERQRPVLGGRRARKQLNDLEQRTGVGHRPNDRRLGHHRWRWAIRLGPGTGVTMVNCQFMRPATYSFEAGRDSGAW